MNRRAIAILGAIFLLIVITLGFIIYQRSQSKKTNSTEDTTQTQEQDQTTDSQNQAPTTKAIKLTDDQVISPVLFFQGNGITYFNKQGQLFQNDLQISGDNTLLTNKRELTIPLKSGITKIIWPYAGNNFLAELGSAGSQKTWSVFDSDKGTYTDLPNRITSIDWMPDGDKIIYIWLGNDNKSTLNIANPDNSGYQKLADIWENDDEIRISPDGRSFLYFRTKNSEAVNKINLATTDGKVFRSVVADGYNFGVSWAPDSKQFIFGKKDSNGQIGLWLGNIETGLTKSLGVFTTPEKSVWTADSQSVISAVPNNGSTAGLTQDTFYKIAVSSGEKKSYETGIAVDGRELFTNSSADRIFFKNLQDGALYYLDLK